jgi:hypothetical protein
MFCVYACVFDRGNRVAASLSLAVNSQFVLRRSAGFAMSFQSILRSEPTNATPVLLPDTMFHLLTLAFDGSIPAVYHHLFPHGAVSHTPSDSAGVHERCRVHALNILKLLFHDASLAGTLERYIAAAMQAAITGFQSSSWAVRNSSMMVFAVVTTR